MSHMIDTYAYLITSSASHTLFPSDTVIISNNYATRMSSYLQV